MYSLYKSSCSEQEKTALPLNMRQLASREQVADTLSITGLTVSSMPSFSAASSSRAYQLQSEGMDNELVRLVCACDMPLPTAELSVKTYNALIKSRIMSIEQLCALELRDLKWLRSLGKKAEKEIIAYRIRLGLPMKP